MSLWSGNVRCFYAQRMGRPSLAPGRLFPPAADRVFRGHRQRAARLRGDRRIRRLCADFLGVGLNQMPHDHSTISRTRRLIDVETHQAVLLAEKDLMKGKTVGVDGTTLEANAALRSIVRRDTGEGYQEFLTRLAQESGIDRKSVV